MASVDGNSPRSCASDTPEASAIAAKPICSTGFSATRLRKAAMILSRSLAGAAAAGRRDERADDLRADRRAMTTLLLNSFAQHAGGMRDRAALGRRDYSRKC